MKQKKMTNKLMSWILALVLMLTTVVTGWTPALADTVAAGGGITLTVIGDTGNHNADPDEHTGYVYWLKDYPLNVNLDDLADTAIAKNCSDQIKAALTGADIEYEFGDSSTLYMQSMSKDGALLESSYPSMWSVIVAYADGSFNSNGWGPGSASAQLKPGCRLIYYWTDNGDEDCRLSTDESYMTQLNYDTDAVTGISMYTEEDPDQAAGSVSCEVGNTVNLKTKLTVPPASKVSRELKWESSDATVAEVSAVSGGAAITGKSAGQAEIKTSIVNTLGDIVEASCQVTVTSSGTAITGLRFAEGNVISMRPWDVRTLTPIFDPVPDKGEMAPILRWSSSKPETAAVDPASGEIEALAPGETVITAAFTNNKGTEVKAACTVTVESVPLTGIGLDQTNMDLDAGDKSTLNVRFLPDNATDNPQIVWETDKTNVAKVEGSGRRATVTAIGGGTATITVRAGDEFAAVCTVRVRGEEVPETPFLTGVSVTGGNALLDGGEVFDPQAFAHEVLVDAGTKSVHMEFRADAGYQITVNDDAVSAADISLLNGEATVKVTVTGVQGDAAYTFTIKEREKTTALKQLVFSKDSSGNDVYAMQSDLDQETKECTVIIPENTNSFYLKPVLADGISGTIQAKYKNYNFTKDLTMDLKDGTFTGFSGVTRLLQSDQAGKDMTVTVTVDGTPEDYVVHVIRESLISGMTLKDDTGASLNYEPKAFSVGTREYTATVPDTVNSVNIALKANNAGSKKFTVNGETAANGNYTLELTGGETTAIMRAGNGSTVPAEYVLKVRRLASVKVSFTLAPDNAVVVLYDKDNVRINGENNSFSVLPGDYTYVVSKTGYIAQKETISVTDDMEKTITLAAAPESTLEILDSEWPGLRNDENNQAIVGTMTPVTAESTGLKWKNKVGVGYDASAVSSPILVDGFIYCYAGEKLVKLNKDTGESVASGDMVNSSSFAINPPFYADGMIFVGLAGGRLQAFNAATLESLWVYTDPLKGQPNTSIRYSDGYVYAGFWNSEVKDANFVCISVTDEDPGNPTEDKNATWTYTTPGGYYWAGSYTSDKFVVVGTDDGASGNTSPTASLQVFEKETGVLAACKTGYTGDIRSDISYDPEADRIYFTSKGGYLYSEKIDWTTGEIIEGESKAIALGGMSTSTPLIYKGRAYVGVSGSAGQFAQYGGHNITVIDLDSWSIAYRANTKGYPQTSGLLTTAYEDMEGYVYVYFMDNYTPGSMRYIKDKADTVSLIDGVTETDSQGVKHENCAPVLYTPQGDTAQYCICSPICDADGTLYFKNDSGYMMAVTRNSVYLTDAVLSGGNAAFYGESAFNGQVLTHEVVVDPGTEKIHLDLTASSGATVSINGKEGASQDVALENGVGTIQITLSNGEDTGSYTFTVRSKKQNAALKGLKMTSGNGYTGNGLKLSPQFDTEVLNYETAYDSEKTFLNVWPEIEDSDASIKVSAVSGVRGCSAGDEIEITATWGTYDRYAIYFADSTYKTPAVVKITVTAEDGVTTKDYTVSLAIDTSDPTMEIGADGVTDRTSDRAKLSLNASEKADGFYLVASPDAQPPDAAEIIKGGTAFRAEKGDNLLDLTGLTPEAGKIYLVLEDIAGNRSVVYKVEIPESQGIVGDINGDGKVTITDANQLLKLVVAGGDVDLAVGDINGDGKITITDANQLLKRVVAGE